MTTELATRDLIGEERWTSAQYRPRWLHDLFRMAVEKRASDLHLRAPSSPVLRIDGDVVPQHQLANLSAGDVQDAFRSVASSEQREVFEREQELDFAIQVPDLCRFRVNALRQRGSISLAFRLLPFRVPTIDDLGLPSVLKQLALRRQGLILVTGPTGSGKSTTLAAMVDYLNENYGRNIIMIEDPIEYVHTNKKCIIAQRTLGEDTKSFAAALKHALRHDADTIVVGEIRDLDTINTAVLAAETGHLVLGTLHTVDAVRSIDRIVDMCPADQRKALRLQLSQVLLAVISQTLLPRIGGGRVAAFEIMVANPAIVDLIREERTAELSRNMECSTKEEGMQTMNQALARLVKAGLVSREEAMARSKDAIRLGNMLVDA